jgi:hypothetical protein
MPARPIQIYYREDKAGSNWIPVTDRIENSGRYVWVVPATIPPRFHLKVTAVDKIGNVGEAETIDTGPILLDRAPPQGPHPRPGPRPLMRWRIADRPRPDDASRGIAGTGRTGRKET